MTAVVKVALKAFLSDVLLVAEKAESTAAKWVALLGGLLDVK